MRPGRIRVAQGRQPPLKNGAHLERAHIGVTGLRGRHGSDPALFWSKSQGTEGRGNVAFAHETCLARQKSARRFSVQCDPQRLLPGDCPSGTLTPWGGVGMCFGSRQFVMAMRVRNGKEQNSQNGTAEPSCKKAPRSRSASGVQNGYAFAAWLVGGSVFGSGGAGSSAGCASAIAPDSASCSSPLVSVPGAASSPAASILSRPSSMFTR